MTASSTPLTPGRLLYLTWHRPLGFLRRCRLRGGFRQSWLDHRGEVAMRRAALHLPVLPADPREPTRTVWFLTGQRFWHQTLFCAWSLRRAARCPLRLRLIDDGSLTGAHTAPFHQHFEEVSVISRAAAFDRLHQSLPPNRFPFLHSQWRTYPNLRKLTDPHLASPGWNLVLDSDMLFFRRPEALLDWAAHPVGPLHATDTETAYGYPDTTLEEISGGPVPPLVNVGLTGLDGRTLDWERIESLCRRLIERHGTHYFLEQALIAILVAPQSRTVLPAADYVTLPRPPEALECRAVLHHYVAGSKRWYFRHNWRKLLTS